VTVYDKDGRPTSYETDSKTQEPDGEWNSTHSKTVIEYHADGSEARTTEETRD
jgi:hypothetical protein